MELVVVNVGDLIKAEADRVITRAQFDERARASVREQLERGIVR